MDIEKRNQEIIDAFHRAGVKGKNIIFNVLDSGAVRVSTMRPVNMTPGYTTDVADHGTKVAWLLHEACPDAEIRSYYCAAPTHLNTALASVIECAKGEPDKQHVVNISVTTSGSAARLMEPIIQQLEAMNIPVVCAAGNDGEERLDKYPSCFEAPYTVSAIETDGAKCDFTTWHDEVDFAEFGRKVSTMRADGARIRQSGTSFASPILAGKIGLLLCEQMQKGKRLTDDELYERLKGAAIDLGTDGRDPYFGWGSVDIMPQAKVEPIPDEPIPDEPVTNEPVQTTGVSAEGLVEWCLSQLGQIYVWGGNGQEATLARIKAMETSTTNQRRATALYEKRKAQGEINPLRIYDCSGLISRYLQDNGMVKSKRNCNHLAAMCGTIHKTVLADDMRQGDLVFRYSNTYYHVGVYVGGGLVVESKGRDDGVVMRKLDASGASYWNRWGRLTSLGKEEAKVAQVLKVTNPLMRGESVRMLQTALNALGYPSGVADGVCGKNTIRALDAFVVAHSGAQGTKLPESITIHADVGGKAYKGQIGG